MYQVLELLHTCQLIYFLQKAMQALCCVHFIEEKVEAQKGSPAEKTQDQGWNSGRLAPVSPTVRDSRQQA